MGKNMVRDTYLDGLQKIVNREFPELDKLKSREAKEARHIFDLQFKQLAQDMIEAGDDILIPKKKHIDFLLEPIDDWLRYIRYRTVFKKDNRRYRYFLGKLAWEDLSIYIANSFYKKHKYLPYQILTKEDLRQEAHLALLIAKKDYKPGMGKINAFYFTAIYNHFFKLYEKANAEKRKSENKKYQLKYMPAYSEGFMEPEPGIFSKMDLARDGDNTITFQRFKSREHFDICDEQEYSEPSRIELRDGPEHDLYFIGSQLYLKTNIKPSLGYKAIEKVSCPLGYGKGQNDFVRGIVWDYQHKKYLKQYLPDDAFKGRDLIFYKGHDPRKIFLNEYKKTLLPYQQKYFIRELMKRAGRHYQEPHFIPGFKHLKREAFEILQTFPGEQSQFFNLFYNDENIIISRNIIKKRFSNSIKDDFVEIENPIAGNYIEALGDENITYKTQTLKDAARILKIRSAKMKPLNDDGKEILRKHFLDRYGINIIRDTTDKKVKNKTHYFRTNFQVRELLKK